VTGFGGCNNLTGSYEVKGDTMTISRVASTRMACLQGMEIEGALFKVIEQVRSWKIAGEHLELYDASGNVLARFEARALK
jgi:heat shock protein HslJ